jgi:ribonuclease HI/pterin-4a-carbinolamine dehydratase
MWQETKHGLYKQFVFDNFKEAFEFMKKVSEIAERLGHYPRWENQWNVVQIWLITSVDKQQITDKDKELARNIDDILKDLGENNNQNYHKNLRKLTLYADGGSRGNPGPSASGFVIIDEDNNIIVDKGIYLGITTNNQAEYTALKLALEECLKIGCSIVDVYMDSLLVINQMKGIFKVKNRDLWPIHDAINNLIKKFNKVTFQHVPRELNKLADSAVNRALDEELTKTSK